MIADTALIKCTYTIDTLAKPIVHPITFYKCCATRDHDAVLPCPPHLLVHMQLLLLKRRWSFIMTKGASYVGVVSSEFDGTTSLLDTLFEGCSYCPDGYKVIKGSKQQYGEGFAEGDRIQVEIELISGQVNFLKNDIDQGIAYFLPKGISVFPLVHLGTKGDMVASQHLFMDYPRGPATVLHPCKRRLTKERTGWDDGICLVAGTYTLGTAAADNLSCISWRFMVEIGTRVTIGIIKSNSRGTRKNIANEEYGWCMCQDGKKYHNGIAEDYAHPIPLTYCIVKMDLDLVARTLRFHVNGKDLGVAFADLPTGLMVNAAVSLFKKDDSIYLLHPFKSVPIAKGTAILPVKPAGLGLWLQRTDTENWDNGTVVAPDALVLGDLKASGLKEGDDPRVRYSFLIHSGEQSAFGIVTDQYDVKDGYLTEHGGWGLRQCDGKVRDRGSQSRKHAAPFVKPGTIVDVEVDVKQRSLRFYINNQGYGIAYSNLPDGLKVHAAVSLYNASCAVTMMWRPMRNKLHKLGDDLLLMSDETISDAIRITKTVGETGC